MSPRQSSLTLTEQQGSARSRGRKTNWASERTTQVLQLPGTARLPQLLVLVCVVYKADLTEVDRKATKYYFGLTESTFKQHYANHQTNFRYEWYRNLGELSKHVLKLKDENKKFVVECSIQQKAPTFSPGSMRCQVPDRKTVHNDSRPDDAPQQTNRVDIDVQTAEKVLVVTVRSWLQWLVLRDIQTNPTKFSYFCILGIGVRVIFSLTCVLAPSHKEIVQAHVLV